MPKLMNQSASLVAQTISNFGFSGTRIEDLGASEYTLANIEIDLSPSTSGYVSELKKALGTIIESLAKSPRAENLLVRVETFHDNLTEVHGFTGLNGVTEGDYNIACGGRGTALLDAILSGIEACGAYGKLLNDKDFAANAVTFIITDGMENSSQKARNTDTIVKAVNKVRTDEDLESIKTILIGVGDQINVESYLHTVQAKAQIDQYLWIGDATPAKLAKLADFISKSVSSASQALGTGGPSQNLTF
jgi:hypothetical protein